jgi:hypothetical protein
MIFDFKYLMIDFVDCHKLENTGVSTDHPWSVEKLLLVIFLKDILMSGAQFSGT